MIEEQSSSLSNLLRLTRRAMTFSPLLDACKFSKTVVRAPIKHLKLIDQVTVKYGLFIITNERYSHKNA
jgi:hypothetical protein